jgi:preprotein translocase subunit SecE
LGGLTFLLLRSNRKSVDFVTDSVAELSRVVWPSAKEVRFGTIVVIITVVMAGIVLGALDIGFTAVMRTLLGA